MTFILSKIKGKQIKISSNVMDIIVDYNDFRNLVIEGAKEFCITYENNAYPNSSNDESCHDLINRLKKYN